MLQRLLVVLTVAACSKGSAPANPSNAAAPTAAPSVTLVKLENGDRACYVHLVGDDGKEQALEGAFELCPGQPQDASSMINKRVLYTTKKANVLAASCNGDVDCGKSDEVDLVISITLAPGATTGGPD